MSRRGFLRIALFAVVASSAAGSLRCARAPEPAPAPAQKEARPTGSEVFHFFHAADPQFFMAEEAGARWRKAVEHANRLRPAFVAVGGDIINGSNDPGKRDRASDEKQARAYLEIARELSEDIPLRNVAGNHDVCRTPTPETLAWYEARFGEPWHSFVHGRSLFIVLESNLIVKPARAEEAAARQLAWLEGLLRASGGEGYRHRIVFMHHPLCLKTVDEADSYDNIPRAARSRLLELFREHGVEAVFSGHLHRNCLVRADGIELVATGSVGKALGNDPPGVRIVKVSPDGIEHRYYPLDEMPERLE